MSDWVIETKDVKKIYRIGEEVYKFGQLK